MIVKRPNGLKPDPIELLQAWQAQWKMISGRIACTDCHSSQRISQAGQSFVHLPVCGAVSHGSQRPWRELQEILLIE